MNLEIGSNFNMLVMQDGKCYELELEIKNKNEVTEVEAKEIINGLEKLDIAMSAIV
jgi:hypothetical protein